MEKGASTWGGSFTLDIAGGADGCSEVIPVKDVINRASSNSLLTFRSRCCRVRGSASLVPSKLLVLAYPVLVPVYLELVPPGSDSISAVLQVSSSPQSWLPVEG